MSDQKQGLLVIIVAGVLGLVLAYFGIEKLHEKILAAYQDLGKVQQEFERLQEEVAALKSRKTTVEGQLEKVERQFKEIKESPNQNLVDALQALAKNPTTTTLLADLQKLQTSVRVWNDSNAGIKICSYTVPLAVDSFTDGTVAPSSWTPKHCLEYNKKTTGSIKFRLGCAFSDGEIFFGGFSTELKNLHFPERDCGWRAD